MPDKKKPRILTDEEYKFLFDKISDKNYSKEERIERYRKQIALRKKIKAGAKKGKILINNGKEQKFILEDLPVPDGWTRGAIK